MRNEWNKNKRGRITTMNTYNCFVNLRSDMHDIAKQYMHELPLFIFWKYDGKYIEVSMYSWFYSKRELIARKRYPYRKLDRDLDWIAEKLDKLCNSNNPVFERKWIKFNKGLKRVAIYNKIKRKVLEKS